MHVAMVPNRSEVLRVLLKISRQAILEVIIEEKN